MTHDSPRARTTSGLVARAASARGLAAALALVSLGGGGSGPALPGSAATGWTAAAGCAGADDSLVLVGGQHIDASAIDRDPLAMLPGGAIMVSYLDAATMFTSSLGGEVHQIVLNLLPLGPEANFSPSRDVVKVYGGLYAM